MLIQMLLIATAAAAGPASGEETPPAGPAVELWTNRNDDVLRAGEAVRVYFRTEANAYVTVFRVDTDGRLEVLFPEAPWENNYARRGDRYEIRRHGRRDAFVVNEYPGQGFLFAVTSQDPFNYADLITSSRWDYRYVAHEGRIIGDPYVAFTDLIDVIVPHNYVAYDFEVLPYYVEEHYDYPRFLCYDCHAYAQYPVWDPYQDQCVRFSVVVYDDAYYYPAHLRPGERVVFTRPRPAAAGPRYVVVERNPVEPFVRWVDRQTPVNDPGPRRLLSDPPNRRNAGATPLPTPRRITPNDDLNERRRPTLQRRDPNRPQAQPAARPPVPVRERPRAPERRKPDSTSVQRRRPKPDTTASGSPSEAMP